MRKYLLKDDKRPDIIWGTVIYDDTTQQFRVIFSEDIDITRDNPPMYVGEYIKQGYREVPSHLIDDWIRARVIPPTRMNIDEILRHADLKFYTVIDMLELTNGRASYDTMYIERIE